jgi:hypothetical protein
MKFCAIYLRIQEATTSPHLAMRNRIPSDRMCVDGYKSPRSRFMLDLNQGHSIVMKQREKSKRPVVFTVNGKAAAVVQDVGAYQRLLDIAASADEDEEEAIRQGLDDVAHGRTRPAREFFEEFRRKHGMPR